MDKKGFVESGKKGHPECMKRVAIRCLLIASLAGFRLHAQSGEADINNRIETVSDTAPVDSFATIQGILKDDKGNPIISAYVECSSGGVIQGREVTDLDGNYTIGALSPGKMTLTFKFQGKESVITDISLASGQTRNVNGTLTMTMCPAVILRIACRNICLPPIIDPKYPGGHTSHTDAMLW